MTKKIVGRSILIIALLSLTACGIKQGTINSYTNPTYKKESVKRLAVFSIRNARFAPSESRQINKKIIQAMHEKNPNIEILSPSKSSRLINSNNMADDWADFIEDYYTSGIPNQELLTKISKKLNVDAIMQGQVIKIFQQDGNSWDVYGTTRITISYSILDSNRSDSIWEVSADGIVRNPGTIGMAPPIMEALDLALNKISKDIPYL